MHGLNMSSTSSSSDCSTPLPFPSFSLEFDWAEANALMRPLHRVKRMAWKYSFRSLVGVFGIADDEVVIPSQDNT